MFDGTENLVAAKRVLRMEHHVRCPATEHHMYEKHDCITVNANENVTCSSLYTVLPSDACNRKVKGIHKGAYT